MQYISIKEQKKHCNERVTKGINLKEKISYIIDCYNNSTRQPKTKLNLVSITEGVGVGVGNKNIYQILRHPKRDATLSCFYQHEGKIVL